MSLAVQPDCLKGSGSVWNCLWGYALKRSPGINHKSRVLYPNPVFLSSVTWPSMPKKHNGLLINQIHCLKILKTLTYDPIL